MLESWNREETLQTIPPFFKVFLPTGSTSCEESESEESDLNIGEGLAVEREPQGGRGGGKEGAGLVQVVWRNEYKNNHANDNVGKDRKRYVHKHIISKLHCLRSGPGPFYKKDEKQIMQGKTQT